MMNKAKLEIELGLFYTDMHEHNNLTDLLKITTKNNFVNGISEIATLIRILLTIPMTTTEPGRFFQGYKE